MRTYFIIAIICLLFSISAGVHAHDDIQVKVDGESLELDVTPKIVEGRTLLPFRAVFDVYNADVEYDPATHKVSAIVDDVLVELEIDNKIANINDNSYEMDVPAKVVRGRTLVPVRLVSESLGSDVDWDEATRTVIINTFTETKKEEKDTEKADAQDAQFYNPEEEVGFSIGDSEDYLVSVLGQPNRIDWNEHGFKWYIYLGKQYEYFIMVGVQDDEVVGIYTNTEWLIEDNIRVGMDIHDALEQYDDLDSFAYKRGTAFFSTSSSTHLKGNGLYYTFFEDTQYSEDKTVLLGLKIVSKEVENYFANANYKDEERVKGTIARGYKKQSVDIVNAYRERIGLPYLSWDNTLSGAATLHSRDMHENNYFDHVSKDGSSHMDRIKAFAEETGFEYNYSRVSENISRNATAIFSFSSLMNSPGHRRNLLRDFTEMGVGVSMDLGGSIYLTQKFGKIDIQDLL